MTYSGLTGGRENKDVVEAYLDSIINEPERKNVHLKAMKNRFEQNKTFVLERGGTFLKPLSHGDIDSHLHNRGVREMNQLCGDSASPDWQKNYTVVPSQDQSKGSFILKSDKGKFLLNVTNAGGIDVFQIADNGHFYYFGDRDSFKQFELQDLS